MTMPAERFVYVDEIKAPAFHLVATIVSAGDVPKVKTVLQDQLKKNQRRIHFRNEQERRKREILSAAAPLPCQVRIYEPAVGSNRRQNAQRAAALIRLMEDLATEGPARIFIENDESRLVEDRRILSQTRRRLQAENISFCHVSAHDEPGLWVSDIVAWCWHRRGWREHVEPLVVNVTAL